MKAIILMVMLSTLQVSFRADLERSVASEDVRALYSMFQGRVSMETPSVKGVYSKRQSKQILRRFFKKYPCDSFKIVKTGRLAGGVEYYRGKYNSAGKSMKVVITVRNHRQKKRISALRFKE